MELLASSVHMGDRMKNGLEKAWRYLTDWEAMPSSSESIYYMGGERFDFSLPAEDKRVSNDSRSQKLEWPVDFRMRFRSQIICSYRTQWDLNIGHNNNKPRGPAPALDSDVGWGCMLRTCQSLLAGALIRMGMNETDILTLLLDSSDCPFSIQAISQAGLEVHKKEVGSWFGPSTAGAALSRLVNSYEHVRLKVILDTDQVVYENEVMALAKRDDGTWTPVLVLVATRLGINQVNPLYFESIKDFFELPQSMGIAGGRPSSSYYFVASQGDDLFYLDPHHPKPSVPFWLPIEKDQENALGKGEGDRRMTLGVPHCPGRRPRRRSDWTEEELASFHCDQLRKCRCSDLDPSMLIGYLCQKESDWTSLRQHFERAQKRGREVLFHIADKRPDWGKARQGGSELDAKDDDVVSLSELDVEGEEGQEG